MSRVATAAAPATVANVAVGFDVLGFALDVAQDEVRVEAIDGPPGQVEIVEISGATLPTDPTRNSASVAVAALAREVGCGHAFRLSIQKGIPLSAGMGGSAASAVAATVAAAALLDERPDRETLCRAALAGEAVAAGAAHADNVAPALVGGFVLVLSHDPPEIVELPTPRELRCSLVHPHLELKTRDARAALDDRVTLAQHSRQNALMGGLLVGCVRGDFDLIGRCLRDEIVEPQRAALIPHFADVADAAREAGALGVSIAGGGPSLFAWSRGEERAAEVTEAMRAAWVRHSIDSDCHTAPVGAVGAHLVEVGE